MKRLFLLLGLVSSCFGAIDTFSITDKVGSARTNIPVKIHREFAVGEFNGTNSFPQVTLCTDNTYSSCATSVSTQVNVDRHHISDNSIAGAYLSFIVASLSGSATNFYKIQSQANCGGCGVDLAETPTKMLSTVAPNYDFDAQEVFTNAYLQGISGTGAVKTASARSMISNLPQATFAGAVNNTTTSIAATVTNGVFPCTVAFDIYGWNSGGGSPYTVEKMRVIACSGTAPNLTFTVVRGFFGSTATAHQNLDHIWLAELNYIAPGSIATMVKIFDPISKLNDLGWQPINIATFTSTYNSSATSISGISNTTGWTNNMLVRLQSAVGGVPNGGTHIQYALVSPTSGSTANINTKGPYPAANSNLCSSFTGGNIYPDQWEDPTDPKYTSLRPYFVVTFWPSLKKYQIEDFIVENGDSEKAQDLHYDLLLKMGCGGNCASPAPTTVYNQTNIWHTWSKRLKISRYNDPAGTNTTSYTQGSETVVEPNTFWDGDPTVSPFYPGPLAIDHNAAYLVTTPAFPFYDVTNVAHQFSEAFIAQSWDGTQRDQEGTKAFPGNWKPTGVTCSMVDGVTTTMTLSLAMLGQTTAYAPVHWQCGNERVIAQYNYGTTSATVIRGMDGTSPVAHTNDTLKWTNEFGDPAKYDKIMGAGGVSEYSNFNTIWNVEWLYTQDPRAYLEMQGLAEIAGAFPAGFREGRDNTRYLRQDCGGGACGAKAGTGLGQWVTPVDRPTFRSEIICCNVNAGNAGDQIIPVSVTSAWYGIGNITGTSCIADSGWTLGYNHFPDAFSFDYAITGDPFDLDGMQAWAAMSNTYLTHSAGSINPGPDSTYATMAYLINNRQVAWFGRETGLSIRERAYAGFFSPDGDENQTAFGQSLYDADAGLEATHNIRGNGSGAFGIIGQFEGDVTYGAAWTWNFNNLYTPQAFKVDSMLGLFGNGYTPDVFSQSSGSGTPETYTIFKVGRTISNKLGGTNSSNANSNLYFPTHASGVGIYDIAAGSLDNPGPGTLVTTTSRGIDGITLINTATANVGGFWQVSISPGGLPTSNISLGDTILVVCATNICTDAEVDSSVLGVAHITAFSNSGNNTLITLDKAATGGGIGANHAYFVDLSLPLVAGGCSAITTSSGGNIPKRMYVENTGNHQEIWYIGSCPTAGPGTDVMIAFTNGTAVNGDFGAGFGNAYVATALGRAYEMGYTRVLPMLTYLEEYYVNGLTDPTYNPWYMKSGTTGVIGSDMTILNTWAKKAGAVIPWVLQPSNSSCLTSSSQATRCGEVATGFRFMDMTYGATSYCGPTGLANCAAALNFLTNNIKQDMIPIACPVTCSGLATNSPHNVMKFDLIARNAPAPPCAISNSSPLPNGVINQAYSQVFTQNGNCAGGGTWSKTAGTLPTGLVLDGTGSLSGTPSVAGLFTFTVTYTDGVTNPSKQFNLTINSACTISQASPLPNGFVSILYSLTIATTGCVGPNSWSVISGALPNGLVVNSSTGAITGTPALAVATTPIFQITDSTGTIFSKELDITILQNPVGAVCFNCVCVGCTLH